MNETYFHFYFYFLHFCFLFYLFFYHISDSLFYLSHQIITAEYKMSHIDYSKKMFKNSADQFYVIQAADCYVIFITRNKIKKTSKWINANKENTKWMWTKKTQSECKQKNAKWIQNECKQKKVNKTHFHFYFYFFHFCLLFYLLFYHISDLLSYLSHQIIIVKHKISHINHSKKMFKNSTDQFHAV